MFWCRTHSSRSPQVAPGGAPSCSRDLATEQGTMCAEDRGTLENLHSCRL